YRAMQTGFAVNGEAWGPVFSLDQGTGVHLAAAQDVSGIVNVVGIGLNGSLYADQGSGAWWTGFSSIAGPARLASVAGHDLRVNSVGTDESLYEIWRFPGGWVGPYKLYSSAPPTQVLSRTAV